jgi:4'-phosphopantetheinyl transferase
MTGAPFGAFAPLAGPLGNSELRLHAIEFAPWLDQWDIVEKWLSAEERRRAGALRSASVRERFVLAHAYLRAVLANYTAVDPAEVSITVTATGKPVLACHSAERSRVGFSLTHNDTHAVVAVAESELIGVDVERPNLDIDVLGIANRYFSPDEADALVRSRNRRIDFVRLWTCKEAFVKAIGLGLAYPLDAFTVRGFDGRIPEIAHLKPPFGPCSEWSLRCWPSFGDCFVAVAIKSAKAIAVRTALWPGPPFARAPSHESIGEMP